MEGLRKFVNILVLVFLVYAVLVLLNVISTEYLDATFTSFSPENYYKVIFGIAAGFLLLYLVVSNLSILALKRERNLLNNRINELKATLYDRKEDAIRNQPRGPQTGTSSPDFKPSNPIFPPDNLQ